MFKVNHYFENFFKLFWCLLESRCSCVSKFTLSAGEPLQFADSKVTF